MDEKIIEQLEALIKCEQRCEGCPVRYQDEGDKEPWCGVNHVLRNAISRIKDKGENDGPVKWRDDIGSCKCSKG